MGWQLLSYTTLIIQGKLVHGLATAHLHDPDQSRKPEHGLATASLHVPENSKHPGQFSRTVAACLVIVATVSSSPIVLSMYGVCKEILFFFLYSHLKYLYIS